MDIVTEVDNMLSLKEAARLLHVHPNTLRRWTDKGIVKSFCISQRGDRRFTRRDINQCLAELNGTN